MPRRDGLKGSFSSLLLFHARARVSAAALVTIVFLVASGLQGCEEGAGLRPRPKQQCDEDAVKRCIANYSTAADACKGLEAYIDCAGDVVCCEYANGGVAMADVLKGFVAASNCELKPTTNKCKVPLSASGPASSSEAASHEGSTTWTTTMSTFTDGMVAGWNVRTVDTGDPLKYKIQFEWEHVHSQAVVVDYVEGSKVFNPVDDPRCSGTSEVVSPKDGLPFWMPRFISRPVPPEVAALTGIRYASVDWQPCGHKDITICHAESHYDIHFYYVEEADLASMPMCNIGSPQNPDLPVCHDLSAVKANHDYFLLINRSIPVSMATSSAGSQTEVPRDVNFCVDASSAILRSGVHYGDKSDTLEEWKTPVTIIGSHDCELKFFEPMVSWKWIANKVSGSTWPKFRVSNITYADKSAFPAIPTAWEIEVSDGCQASSIFSPSTQGVCTMKLTIEGDACRPGDSCTPVGVKQCGTIVDCTTGLPYQTPTISAR